MEEERKEREVVFKRRKGVLDEFENTLVELDEATLKIQSHLDLKLSEER